MKVVEKKRWRGEEINCVYIFMRNKYLLFHLAGTSQKQQLAFKGKQNSMQKESTRFSQ